MCITYESLLDHHSETRDITVTLELPEYVEVTIDSDPTGISFTIDGVAFTTPTSLKLTPGTYHIVFPSSYGDRDFESWEDGSTDYVRDVTIQANAELFATYTKGLMKYLPYVAGAGAIFLAIVVPLALKRRKK